MVGQNLRGAGVFQRSVGVEPAPLIEPQVDLDGEYRVCAADGSGTDAPSVVGDDPGAGPVLELHVNLEDDTKSIPIPGVIAGPVAECAAESSIADRDAEDVHSAV